MDGMFHMHPSKTAGTSIIKTLIDNTNFAEKYGEIYKFKINKHVTPVWYNSKDQFSHNIEDDSFITLTVREPYSRIISLVSWLTEDLGQPVNISDHMSLVKRIKMMSLDDLKSIKKLPADGIFGSSLPTLNSCLWTSYTYSDWEDSVTNQVKIIRFEHLEDDFQDIYPGLQLSHIHKRDTSGINFAYVQEMFDSQAILDMYNNYYESDFERYGYTMHTHLDDLLQEYSQSS